MSGLPKNVTWYGHYAGKLLSTTRSGRIKSQFPDGTTGFASNEEKAKEVLRDAAKKGEHQQN